MQGHGPRALPNLGLADPDSGVVTNSPGGPVAGGP